MLTLISDLFRHQSWADSALLAAVRKHTPAAEDPQLRELLHHIVAVQRFFLATCEGKAFDRQQEMHAPATLDELTERFRVTHALEEQWIASLEETALSQTIEIPFFKGRAIPVWEALVQVCMHSQGHRAQCLTRLRTLGGQPPTLDYILWTKDRPSDLEASSAAV
jgi:uncharacterized damage-inducible protein DinB